MAIVFWVISLIASAAYFTSVILTDFKLTFMTAIMITLIIKNIAQELYEGQYKDRDTVIDSVKSMIMGMARAFFIVSGVRSVKVTEALYAEESFIPVIVLYIIFGVILFAGEFVSLVRLYSKNKKTKKTLMWVNFGLALASAAVYILF